MKASQFFFKTFKEPPHEADIISHQLLERGGFIRKLGKGIYTSTPLMMRVLKKLCQIVREELDSMGGQELALPLLHPAELWRQSGRWDDFTAENLLYTLKDRENREFCLAPTHEEVITALVADWVTSYKHLPLNLYQIGAKFRDEIRPRFGLMRGKEFLMADGYSYALDETDMQQEYDKIRAVYTKIFKRLELNFVVVEAHGGKIGKGKSEEFQVLAEVGEDAVMTCGDYAVNAEAAKSTPPPYNYNSATEAKISIETPGVETIEELSTQIHCDPAQILKTVVYKLIFAKEVRPVLIGIRGDRQINEVKLVEKFGASECTLATEEELKKWTGVGAGFVGPLESKLPFYADKSTESMTNFICAFNQVGKHMKGVNWERDLPRPEFSDFLLAQAGDLCPHIQGGTYTIVRGIEVGHIFNVGTRYTDLMGASYQDEAAKSHPIWMGTYGIGIGRTAAACVEQKHDKNGIIWPQEIAPFTMMITAASTKDESLTSVAEKLYHELLPYDVLLDDRDARLGFKLKDSDLIGIPYKMIVGKTYLNEKKIEIESRTGEKYLLEIQQIFQWAKEKLSTPKY